MEKEAKFDERYTTAEDAIFDSFFLLLKEKEIRIVSTCFQILLKNIKMVFQNAKVLVFLPLCYD